MTSSDGDLFYMQASSIDTSDVTMWCQLASAAASLGNLLLARKSWEQALCCNDRYWPALEGLCTVLFALEDFYCKPISVNIVTSGIICDCSRSFI